MSELPGDLQYTSDHEWLRREDDGTVTIGITDHAQAALGDLVYVELPEVHQDVEAGSDMAVVESVKAASDVYAPADGEITEVNQVCAYFNYSNRVLNGLGVTTEGDVIGYYEQSGEGERGA